MTFKFSIATIIVTFVSISSFVLGLLVVATWKMAPKLYLFEASPGPRAIQMLAKNLGIELDLYLVDGINGEHLKPEFLKLNPTHTIPVLQEEDGFVVWESHAILIYLVEKYGKNDALYPKDGKKRAIVNQRLFFEAANLFTKLFSIMAPFYHQTKTELAPGDLDLIKDAYDLCETLVTATKWFAADSPTIADYSAFSTITTLDLILPIDSQKYPKLSTWIKNCETNLPGTDANKKGIAIYRESLKTFGVTK